MSGSEGSWYECTFCLERVREDEREKHLKQEHQAPGGLDLNEVYKKV